MDNDSPLTVFNLHDLFSAPLQATIDADFEAARQFVRYIRQFGFQPLPDAGAAKRKDWGALRMVAFGVERDRNGFPNTEVVRIPTLSMIPLPLLEVREADFRFAVRILTRERRDATAARGLALGGDQYEDEPDAFQWRAMLAEERRTQEETQPPVNPQLSANMLVNVRVRRGDIPAGIASLIALMNENSQIIRDLIQVVPRTLTLSGQAPSASATVSLLGIDGKAMPHGALLAHYQEDAGFVVEAHGKPWRSGQTQKTGAGGRIEIVVRLLDQRDAAPAGGTIRFEAVEQGFPASQELPVRIKA